MINKVILVGNVGADPEIRTLETGTKVARVRLATTERIFNRQSQETKEHTEWHTVVMWRGLADVADKYVRKGSQIYVEGPLRSNEWTDKEGVKRYGVEIVANDMKLLGRRPEGSGGGSQGYSQPPMSSYGAASGGPGVHGYPGASASAGMVPGAGASGAVAAPDRLPVDDPDDLPF
ncbi:MAG: single-stranded DNA-binding protein [Alistipes sp.]|jgi:single-strand DNA-binding protein|nr:single-stranded DNA-binding protein [Alistipes sp.]